jgi:hypothetical protein
MSGQFLLPKLHQQQNIRVILTKADMFTMNVTSEVFKLHIDDFIIQHSIIKRTTEELEK